MQQEVLCRTGEISADLRYKTTKRCKYLKIHELFATKAQRSALTIKTVQYQYFNCSRGGDLNVFL
jgi:hypothetical protein